MWAKRIGAILTLCLGAMAAAPNPGVPTALDVHARQIFRGGVAAVAVADPFAVANYHATIEGEPQTGQALFRRYRFGWQMLALGIGSLRPCDLRAVGVPAAAVRGLLAHRSIPPQYPRPCDAPQPFVASVSPAEEAVRSVLQNGLTIAYPRVVVVDDWAQALWYGLGGGVALLHATDGRWHVVTGGGGVPDACALVTLEHVPRPIAQQLMLELIRGMSGMLPESASLAACS